MTSDPAAPIEARPRFPIGLTITVAICFAILVSLGVWQIHRLHWKQDLLARVAALQTAPARPALSVLAAGGDLNFVRVELDCPGLAKAPFVEMFGVRESGAGARLISVCPLASGPYKTVLVDRGFIPDSVSARPPVDSADTAPVHVVGVLRTPDRRSFLAPPDDVAHGKFYTRDIGAMAAKLGAAAPAPVFLRAETSSNPGFAALQPSPLPSDIPNNHFQYVLTWFGLAAALVGVYAAMLSRRLKSQ
jgi:surfeit locus 1 family protein